MIRINPRISASDLASHLDSMWALSAQKIRSIESGYDFTQGAPVFTREGRYVTRGWTEWTLGFHFGSALLQFDATRDPEFLELGRQGTIDRLPKYITHMGVHDHGFNIVSTFGNLLRLSREGRVDAGDWEQRYYCLALRASAAVQARRWTPLQDGGFIHSFNGAHSLFADTIRSLRVLALGHCLGQVLLEEGDQEINLLARLIEHGLTTARFNVYYGNGRDTYDVRGRVAHESLFNVRNGSYRCPSTQQGYSAFSTWTRGLAWVILGFAEQLEFLSRWPAERFPRNLPKEEVLARFLDAARASADFYIESSPANGIPYWDTGAPGLLSMANHREDPADPGNDFEPVDSSAAAIACQGLLRLGAYLHSKGEKEAGQRYQQAGLTVVSALLDDPYLSRDPGHQGLLLHSVYHRPNGWDYIPPGRTVPSGESSMWGDYHLREVGAYLRRIIRSEPQLAFWQGVL